MNGRAALALTVANFGAAALNYLFQVHAASVLDATSFGLLSAWLARLTLLGTAATVVQFVSLDLRVDDARWSRAVRVAGLASLGMVALHLVFGRGVPAVWLGASAVVGGILLYALLGQLQARLELGVVAFAVAVTAAVRFALPFATARDVRAQAFFVAHAAAWFAGVSALAAAVMLRRPRTDVSTPSPAVASEPSTEKRLRLRRPILLAFASVVFPLMDVLVVSATQDAATTGAFSRVTLASRIVVFSGAAALQVLLPHQLHAAANGTALPPFARRIQQWLTPAAIAEAVVIGALVDQCILHPSGDERIWLFASCLAAALLVAILGQVNAFAARGRLGVAAACVGGVVTASATAAALATLGGGTLTRYSLAVLVGDALVLLVAWRASRR